MKKKNRFAKIAVLVAVFMIVFAQIAFAAYSSSATFSVPSTDTWVNTSTSSNRLYKLKENSDYHYFLGFTNSKTMWTKPLLRLVNSNYEVRSAQVSMPSAGSASSKGELINASAGYNYYAQIHSNALQSGTDTINFKFNPDVS
ncbi:MAG: hypothetical protein LBB67_05765 [Oscillospiraceae bacterium]|jgi:hypothetical protein|nr:hypothetical protein [Oscillospiraceae bacterium]